MNRNAALSNAVIQLKTQNKMLERQAKKAEQGEKAEKLKLERAMKKGQHANARVHAANAIRKQKEQENLLRLASEVDAVASRVNTAATMQTVAGNMQHVVKSMDIAMKSMDLQKITAIMDGFEANNDNLGVMDEYMREATTSSTAVDTPQTDIDQLMSQTADKIGVELNQDLEEATPAKTKIVSLAPDTDTLDERLKALRN